MIRIICLLVFIFSINPSFGQDVEDEYMIELARELFFGLPIQSDLTTSLSFLNESDKIDTISVIGDTLKAAFLSHPFLDVHSIKGEDCSGSLSLQLLFRNDRIFERQIIADKQSDLKTFNALYDLLKTVTFHIETKAPATTSGYHREDILFAAKDGRTLAHIELSYNPAVFDPDQTLKNPEKTIRVVLAIYDNTLP